VIFAGETDLSVGAILGMAGMLVTTLISKGLPIWLSIVITLIMGIVAGAINGVLVQTTHIPSFIATMGTMTAYRGVAELISGGVIVSGMPSSFKSFAGSTLLGIPGLVWIYAGVALVLGILLAKTIFGRNVYAVGSNAAVAQLSGISVNKIKIAVFSLSGLTAGLAGIMFALRMGQGLPSAGSGYELNCIASAVIGGASFTGGEGMVIGTVFGSFLIQTLQNGGNLLKISSFWLEVVTGVVLIAAVAIDTISKRNRK
jgi:ribose transport system permease protein